jgi:hypothetical protein
VLPPDDNIFLIDEASFDQNGENIENLPVVQPDLHIANQVMPNIVINDAPQPMEIQFE